MISSRLLAASVVTRNFIKTVSFRFYSAKESMEKHGIVPDVVPVAPAVVASVSYESGVSCTEGNELTPRQVKDVPKVEWNAEPSSLYTLCMTDPDAPSRQEPIHREVNRLLHVRREFRFRMRFFFVDFSGITGWSETFPAMM